MFRFTGDKDLVVECPICGHSIEVGIQDEAVCPECIATISVSEFGDAEVLCEECQEVSGIRKFSLRRGPQIIYFCSENCRESFRNK